MLHNPSSPLLRCRAPGAAQLPLQGRPGLARRIGHRLGAGARAQAPAQEGQQLPAAATAVITDGAVPEGHKGLHGFLYGEGGAEAHDSPTASYDFREVGAGEEGGAHTGALGAGRVGRVDRVCTDWAVAE